MNDQTFSKNMIYLFELKNKSQEKKHLNINGIGSMGSKKGD